VTDTLGRNPWSARLPLDPLFTSEVRLIHMLGGPTGASAADQGVRPTAVPCPDRMIAIDFWVRKDAGSATSLKVTVPAHGSILYLATEAR